MQCQMLCSLEGTISLNHMVSLGVLIVGAPTFLLLAKQQFLQSSCSLMQQCMAQELLLRLYEGIGCAAVGFCSRLHHQCTYPCPLVAQSYL